MIAWIENLFGSKKVFKKFFFDRKVLKAETAFCRLRIAVERLKLGKFERRKIFKALLRAAGFVNIRVRERKGE